MPPPEGSAARIEQQAADWLARQAGGSWSALDQAQLTQWLEASTAHKVAFLRLDAVWRQTQRLKALGAASGRDPHLRDHHRAFTGITIARSRWPPESCW